MSMTNGASGAQDEDAAAATDAPRWSVVVPVFNEEAYLARTLASLDRQTAAPFELIIVDNASTDRSAEIARAFARRATGAKTRIVHEPRPGQAPALEAGIAASTGALVAICDADTLYPRDYLEKAGAVFKAGGPAMAAVVAFDSRGDARWRRRGFALKQRTIAALLARQCHGGGYAHAFRREALVASGGYSPDLWPYCLKDHELMHRVAKQGRIGYRFDHRVRPSDRRSDRSAIRWTLLERILYHVTPFGAKDWFFYHFLARRLAARGARDEKLRERDWERASG